MYLNGDEPTFRQATRRSNPYRLMFWAVLILLGISLLRGFDKGTVKPLFMATSTPTRTTDSYVMEGETHFQAGDLNKAIEAYQEATRLDPDDPQLWSKLARIQTYSSNLLTTDEEKRQRLKDGLDSVDQAAKLAPDDSDVRAIRAFVLDWNASSTLNPDQYEDWLTEAEQEAVRALSLDNTNTLALAFYAEILVDQQKLLQALEYSQQASERGESLMDVHRIQGYVYETLGEYNLAIQEYKKAIDIMPNLTFLYIQVGKIYRHLQLYPQSLDYFDKAAKKNQQLGINDPIPYLAIANTYAQQGEFFAAARNVKKALLLNPSSPDVYGQLGMVYFKSRNYESAIPAFECAIKGCSTEKSCEVRQCDPETDAQYEIKGLPLSDSTVTFYFTYGSVLAGLHRPADDYCVQAGEILAQVRAKYIDDPTIMSIVEDSEAICAP
jgi:tetratricopeptide (TPR) repeat protein